MTIGQKDKPGVPVRGGNLLLVSYRRSRDARPESGVAYGEHIIPLTSLSGFTGDILQACDSPQVAAGHLEELAHAAAASATDTLPGTGPVSFCPPVANPEKIICFGLNYRDHASEAGFEPPPVPVFFSKFRNALTGPFDPIVLPRSSHEIDFEGELAVVIGTAGKYIPREDALDHVAGYAVMNDVSARDLQLRTSQRGGDHRLPELADDAAARGHHRHRNPGRRRVQARAAGLPAARRCRRGGDRGHRNNPEPGRE